MAGSIMGMAKEGWGAIIGAGAAVNQGDQQKYAYEYKAQVAENNARLAEQYAQQAAEKGKQQASMYLAKGTGDREKAFTAFAARNLSTGAGTSQEAVIGDIDALKKLDALTIRNNAAREQWGHNLQAQSFRQQAVTDRISGEQAQKAGRAAATSSLISGFGSVGEKWQNYKAYSTSGRDVPYSGYKNEDGSPGGSVEDGDYQNTWTDYYEEGDMDDTYL